MPHVGFSVHTLLTRWEFSPFALVTLTVAVLVGAWYVQSAWALSARGRPWSGLRTASFLTGLVMIDVALQSPVATLTMGYFEAHMAQHLLLMVIAPPLLALGAPMTLALQTSGRTTKTRLLRVLHSQAFRWWSHPIPTSVAYYVSMFVFFLTSAVAVAMTHMWLMDMVNVAFLVADRGGGSHPTLAPEPRDEDGGTPDRRADRVVPGPGPTDRDPSGRLDVLGAEHPCGGGDPVDRGGGVHLPRPYSGLRPVGAGRGSGHRSHRRAAGRPVRGGGYDAHAGGSGQLLSRPGRRIRWRGRRYR